jgi:probable addiction module antidote protein
MSQFVSDAGLRREDLYWALSAEGNSEFATIMKVLQPLGVMLGAEAA